MLIVWEVQLDVSGLEERIIENREGLPLNPNVKCDLKLTIRGPPQHL